MLTSHAGHVHIKICSENLQLCVCLCGWCSTITPTCSTHTLHSLPGVRSVSIGPRFLSHTGQAAQRPYGTCGGGGGWQNARKPREQEGSWQAVCRAAMLSSHRGNSLFRAQTAELQQTSAGPNEVTPAHVQAGEMAPNPPYSQSLQPGTHVFLACMEIISNIQRMTNELFVSRPFENW